MPHIEVHHFPNDLTEAEQLVLGEELREVLAKHLPTTAAKVSVLLTAVEKRDWGSKVVENKLLPNRARLILEPDYLD